MPRKTNPAIKKYKLKSGKTKYKFQVYLGQGPQGKTIVTTRAGFDTYRAANVAFNQLKNDGLNNRVTTDHISVNDLYGLWFDNYKTQVKQSTAHKNLELYENHIKPVFGSKRLDDIKVGQVQLFADKKAKEIVKYKQVVRQLKTLFEYGKRLGYATDNPVDKIIMPKATSRKRRDIEHNVYTRQELEEFLNIAKNRPLKIYTYFMILASTGLRKSEALALTWQDIDLINNLLNVNKTLAIGFDNKLILQSPKTKKSIRQVPISANLRKVLVKYKEECFSDKLFATRQGRYINIAEPENWLQKIYQQNPRLKRISLHGFRHTFATLLIEETAVKPKTVQMIMGHQNIDITLNIYAHVNAANKEDARKSINQLNI